MLKILGPASQGETFCDGLSRRNFLQIGSLGVGLTLADLLAAGNADLVAAAMPAGERGARRAGRR